MTFDSIIDSINKPNECPGDYVGPDGLLYCGRCHAPKQMHGENLLAGKILSIACECKLKEMEAEEEAERIKRIEAIRRHCFPLEATRNHTFANADSGKHIEIAKRYVDNWEHVKTNNYGLLFFGNTGTGKSYAAQCICNGLIDLEIPIIYMTVPTLIAVLMDKNTDRASFFKRLQGIALLVLDDIGAERDTPFAQEQLCSVIDARSEAGKPLICTTNYTLDEMKHCPDQQRQRIFNRLLACCIPVAVVGQSKRDAIGQKKLEAARRLLAI